MNSFKHILNYKFGFIVVFLLNVWVLYPGAFTNDSLHQYQHALSGQYITHHPPVMAFWWSLMMKFWNSPVTMLIFHLILLTGTCYNFYRAFQIIGSKWYYVFILLPFYPIVFLYSFMIWKDVSFTYSYLLIISYLFYIYTKNKKISKLNIGFLIIMLFYGTAVKYQARFILPIISFCIAYTICRKTSLTKLATLSILIMSGVFIAVTVVDNILVMQTKGGGNTESWQYVKLYDLAGISIDQNKELFPDYILEDSKYSKQNFYTYYNNFLVDPLLSHVLPCVNNKVQLKELRIFWFKNVLKYPGSYLKHRYLLFKNTTARDYWVPLPSDLSNLPEYAVKDGLVYKKYRRYLQAFSKFTPFKRSIVFIPLYIFVGLFLRKKFSDARPKALVLMNVMALLFCTIIFFFSMASDARYLLFPATMVLFSHIIFMSLFISYIRIEFYKYVDKVIEFIYARLIFKGIISKKL